MSDFGTTPFPRAPLVGAAALLAMVLMGATATRLTGVGSSHRQDAPILAERDLRFTDQDDGSILVTDAASERTVESVPPGTNGFLRGTLRGLARERHRQGFGAEQPFHLVAHDDGRLTLMDPATGRRVDLESFGPTNEAVFARLIATPMTPVPRTGDNDKPVTTALSTQRGDFHE